ncbi:MAG: phosphoserine phosphatase SerB [Alphaproteobacteria bacterium]|nr:phosphoserine phosphatase SerB [Alphaproteobacteria bacterium]
MLVAVAPRPVIQETLYDISGCRFIEKDGVFTSDDKPDNFREIRKKFWEREIDIFIKMPPALPYRLFLADMDSTIVAHESLDVMAEKMGIGAKVEEITRRAMAGEINFRAAFFERLNLLTGFSADMLNELLDEMQLNEGAAELVQALKRMKIFTAIVSGGPTDFTTRAAERAGFDYHHGNTLHKNTDGSLSGEARPPLLGRAEKKKILEDYCLTLDITPAQIISIGDGANDLDMFAASGCPIGYRAKQIVADSIDNVIMFTPLTSVLHIIK